MRKSDNPSLKVSGSPESALIHSVVHGTNACMVLTDKHGVIIEANEATAKLLKTKSQLIDIKLSQLFTESTDVFEDAFNKLLIEPSESISLRLSIGNKELTSVSALVSLMRIDEQAVMLFTLKKNKARNELNRLYAAIEKSSNTIAISDTDGVTLYVNAAHERFTGYNKKESIGKVVTLFDSRFVTEKRIQEVKNTLLNGKQWKGNYTSQRKNGAFFNINITVSPVFDDNGGIDAFLFHTEYEDEKAESNNELTKSEDQFLALINTLDEGIVRYSESGQIVFFNKRALEILDMNADELVGSPSASFKNRVFDKSGKPLSSDLLPSAVTRNNGKNLWDITVRLKSKDGNSEKWITFNSTAQKNEAGKVISVITTFRDITDKVTSKNEIEAYKERTKLAVEATGIGIWERDFVNGKSYIDAVWSRITGINEEYVNKQDWLNLIHPEDKGEVLDKIYSHLLGETESYRATYRVKTANNVWRWVLDQGVVNQRDEFGNPIAAIGTYTDISDKIEIERNLSRAQHIAKIGSFTYCFLED